MDLSKVQRDVHEFTKQFEPQYWPPLEMMARLSEETGEVAREINHSYGHKKKKPGEETRGLGGELVDIIFTVGCIANSQGIDLGEEWERMMDKLYKRDSNRYEKKEV
jgi:NTP pyrophosphatase (non-canonical NTP hydrolase)